MQANAFDLVMNKMVARACRHLGATVAWRQTGIAERAAADALLDDTKVIVAVTSSVHHEG